MINETILTLTNDDGNSVIIDLMQDEKMHLNFNFSDVVDFSAVGNYTREFRIPASPANVGFFGSIFNVNFDGWFDFRKKVNASLSVNTIPICIGHIQVKKLYWHAGEVYEFEVVFFGETPNLSRSLGNNKLRDLKHLDSLDFTLDFDYIEGQPNDNTIMTLCDKYNLHATDTSQGLVLYGANESSVLKVSHFTPAVKAKYIFDAIISEAGFTYESPDLQENLENVWIPFVNGKNLNDGLGVGEYALSIGLASNQVTTSFDTQAAPYITTFIDIAGIVSGGTFSVPVTGNYTFNIFANGQASTACGVALWLVDTVGGMNDAYTVDGSGFGGYPLYHTFTSGASNTFQLSVTSQIHLNAGQVLGIVLTEFWTSTGAAITWYGDANNESTGLKLLDTEMSGWFGQTIRMKYNAPDMLQIDFIRSIQQMFNLVFVPDLSNQNNLLIQSMMSYLGSGDAKDWSQKLDLSNDISYEPTTDLQKQSFSFKYAEDGDVCNEAYQSAGRTYGEYKVTNYDFDIQNDFATGEDKVELKFAALPSAAYTNSDVVCPRFVNDAGEFVQPKPRIGYWFANFSVKAWNHHTNTIQSVGAKCLSNYSIMNSTVTDKDLNFAPESPLHTIVANPYDNLYNRFWREYYRQLYDGQNRIMEAYFALTLADIYNFRFSDKIYIIDSWWRVLSIDDYVVGEQNMTKLKLIRLLDLPNNCDLTPVSVGIAGDINWLDADGNEVEASEDCCKRYGYYWNENGEKAYCQVRKNTGANTSVTFKLPDSVPNINGTPTRYTAGTFHPVRKVSASTVITSNDRYIFMAHPSGSINIKLPSPKNLIGQEFVFRNLVSGTSVVFSCSGGYNIETSPTLTVTGSFTVSFVSTGQQYLFTSKS